MQSRPAMMLLLLLLLANDCSLRQYVPNCSRRFTVRSTTDSTYWSYGCGLRAAGSGMGHDCYVR